MTPPEGILPNTDVNGDGTVNEEDIALVLAALEAALASPASVWTAVNLQRWIDKAKQHNIRDATFRRGIAVLERVVGNLATESNRPFTKLSESFQSRDVDTVSVGNPLRCEYIHLCCGWTSRAKIDVRTSTCRHLHEQKPCCILGWKKMCWVSLSRVVCISIR